MRKKTPSFIAEFPLLTTPADERELSIRLDAARNIYNACLGESLRRLDLMRESKAWQAAQAMPKHTEKAIEKAQNKDRLKAENKARSEAFKAVQHLILFRSRSSANSAGTHAGLVITLAAMILRRRHCERSARLSNTCLESAVARASSVSIIWNALKAKSRR